MATKTAWKTTDYELQQGTNGGLKDEGQRKYTRYQTRLHSILYRGELFQTTLIHDLSQGGAGLTGAFGVMPYDKVVLQLLDGRKMSATVRWWVQGRCGVVFEQPLTSDDPLLKQALKRARPIIVGS